MLVEIMDKNRLVNNPKIIKNKFNLFGIMPYFKS